MPSDLLPPPHAPCLASCSWPPFALAAAHIPLFLYPFLNTISKTRPFEYLRLTSLGVIGALVKVGALLSSAWTASSSTCGSSSGSSSYLLLRFLLDHQAMLRHTLFTSPSSSPVDPPTGPGAVCCCIVHSEPALTPHCCPPACPALCWQQVDDTEVINFLLSTEIIPLCLRTMETGSELSKTVATFIVQKILLDNVSRGRGRAAQGRAGGAAAGCWGREEGASREGGLELDHSAPQPA